MESKLKPCPFCGGEAKIVHRKKKDVFDIGCYVSLMCPANICIDPKCTECGDGYSYKEEAIHLWNRRVSDGK